MEQLIKDLVSRFTMKIKAFEFTDYISGKPVYCAVDKYGIEWLVESTNPFGFRVKKG